MPPKKSPVAVVGKRPPSAPKSKEAPSAASVSVSIPPWQARLEERVAFTYDPSIEDIASTKTYHEYLATLYPTEATKCAERGNNKTYAQIYTFEDLEFAIRAAWEEACGKDVDKKEDGQIGGVGDVIGQLVIKMQESSPLRVARLATASYSHRPSRIVSIREGAKLPDTLVMWAAFDFVLLPTHALLVHIMKLHCGGGGDRMPPPQRRPRPVSVDTATTNRVYEIMPNIPVKHCFLEGMHFIHPKDVTAKFEKELDTFVFQSIVDATHFGRTAALLAERQGVSGVVAPCHLNANPPRLECYCNPLIGFGLASRTVLLNAISSVGERDGDYVDAAVALDTSTTNNMCLNGDIVVMGMGGNVVCNALVDTFINPFSPECLKAAMAAVTSSTGNSAVTIAINRVQKFLDDNPLFKIHVVEIEPAVFDACVDAGVAPDNNQMPQSKDLYPMLANVPKRSAAGSLKRSYVIRPQDVLNNECHFQNGSDTMVKVFNEARNRVVFHIGVDALATSPATGQSIIGDRIAQLNKNNTTVTTNSTASIAITKKSTGRKYSASRNENTSTTASTVKFIFMDCYDPVVSTMVHPTNVIQMLKPLLHPKGGMLIVNTHVSTPETGTQQDRNKETAAAFLPFAEAFPFDITSGHTSNNKATTTTSSAAARISDSLVVVMRNTGLCQHLVSCMRYDATITTTLKEPQQLELFAKQHTMTKLSSAINEMVEGNTPMGMAISQLVGRVLIGTPSSIAAAQQAAVSKIACREVSDRSKSIFNASDVSFLLNTLWGISKGELILCKDELGTLRRRVRVYTSV